MREHEILLWTVGGLAAATAGYAWWTRNRAGSLIDKLGDSINMLTSTDEARLSQLQPDAQAAFRNLLGVLEADGIRVKVGTTLRTAAAEKSAIETGHTSSTLKVSWHQLGRAADLYPYDPATGAPDLDGKNTALFWRMHQLAADLGFRGIAFNADGTRRYITNAKGEKIWDGGHLEWRLPYGTIAEAVAAEGAAFGLA